VQDEPGVGGAFANPTVRDGVPAEIQPGLVGVQDAQRLVWLERAVLSGGL
jgi:hypothetical protein